MDSDRASRARIAAEILGELDALPPSARPIHIQQTCGDDPELMAVVDFLLKAPASASRQDVGNVGDVGPASDRAADAEPLARPRAIGPYKILETLGEGGFGEVYLAQQTEPIHRVVALKVIKPGMDSRQVIARFEAERQALALMNHPNIAKVLDAGTTPRGSPYFVMELVKGVSITEYCRNEKVPIRERLELFVTVCEAVQHAHMKGIIHRDIKPSNVMVSFEDARPVPKVIDFGIAKATQQMKLTEKTLYTRQRQFMGTPEYMSPEQAEMSGLDVDTRSDIYSLGVLLYEMITGSTPFDEALRASPATEAQKIIRELEPARPSVKLSGAWKADASKRDQSEKLATQLKAEVDWIVMKCLEKDRTHRYESAGALAADVRRFLAGDAVLARPASLAYRVRKFARRHRTGVVGASLVAGALLCGSVLASVGLFSAYREEARSRAAREEKDTAFALMQELIRTEAEPASIPPKIGDAVAQLDAGWLKSQPATAAAIRSAIGLKYLALDPPFARRQFEAALTISDGTSGIGASDALTGLAEMAVNKQDFKTAEDLLARALTAVESEGGGRDPTRILRTLQQTRMAMKDPEGARQFALKEVRWQIDVYGNTLRGHDQNRLALAKRANLLASIGDYQAAADDLRAFARIDSRQVPPQILLAYLEITLGNATGYLHIRDELLQRLSTVEDPIDRLEVLRLGAVAHDGTSIVSQLRQALNSLPTAGDPTYLQKRVLVWSLVHYRSGDLRIVRDTLGRSLSEGQLPWDERPIAEIVMAMCQRGLGDSRDARRWQLQAVGSASEAWPWGAKGPVQRVRNYLIYELLRTQAESMIRAQE